MHAIAGQCCISSVQFDCRWDIDVTTQDPASDSRRVCVPSVRQLRVVTTVRGMSSWHACKSGSNMQKVYSQKSPQSVLASSRLQTHTLLVYMVLLKGQHWHGYFSIKDIMIKRHLHRYSYECVIVHMFFNRRRMQVITHTHTDSAAVSEISNLCLHSIENE